MKRLFTIILVMFTLQMGWAQETNNEVYLEAGLNPVVLLSEETKGDLNWTLKLGSSVGENGNIAVFYERYNEENYVSYGIQPSLQATIIGGLQASVGTEFSLIERYDRNISLFGGDSRMTYATYGFNADLSYQFESFGVFYGADLKRRPDLSSKDWALSTAVGVRFYFL